MENKIRKLVEFLRAGSWETRKKIRSSKFFAAKERSYYSAKEFWLEVA